MRHNLQVFFRSDYGIAIGIACAWQLVMSVLGYYLSPSHEGLFAYTLHWDGGWYSAILHDHYLTNHAAAAFYPLFPLLVGAVSLVSFGLVGFTLAAQLINLVALWLGLVALIQIASYFIPRKYRLLPVLFLLLSPAAFFMHMFYTEALFIAIGSWAYLSALRGKWWVMGILLACLTASRLPSLLFVGLCGLEFLRAHQWNLRKAITPNLAYFLLVPLGFILYGTYLYFVSGNFFGMFSAYKATTDWAYQVFQPNFLETIARAGYQVLRAAVGLRPFDHDIFVNHAIPVLMLGILFVSSIYLVVKVKGRAIPLGIFGLVSIIFFTLNSNVVSVHRYILPCLSIYIAAAYLYSKHPKARPFLIVLAAVLGLIQMSLLALFVTSQFAG